MKNTHHAVKKTPSLLSASMLNQTMTPANQGLLYIQFGQRYFAHTGSHVPTFWNCQSCSSSRGYAAGLSSA